MILFRRTEPSDLLMLSDWIVNDPFHREKLTPEFFLTTGEGVSCYTVEDAEGPVAFMREEVERDAARLHAQFQFPEKRKRLTVAIEEGFPIIFTEAKARGFRQLRFEVDSLALIKAMLRFGFRADLISDL